MKKSLEQQIANDFPNDVAHHVMTVEMDNGVHRCLHFGRLGSGWYSFRVVTWPGHLYIGGDCDDFVFSRLTDMFEFFRSDHGHMDLGYWSEKLQASAARAGYERYSAAVFREEVEQRLTDWIEGEDLTDEQITELREQVADEVLSCADDGEQAAHTAARDFRFNGDEVFTDFWETSLKEYTHGYVWACHAIVWAIQQYDAAKATAGMVEVAHA
jgi:hypothetical protein